MSNNIVFYIPYLSCYQVTIIMLSYKIDKTNTAVVTSEKIFK